MRRVALVIVLTLCISVITLPANSALPLKLNKMNLFGTFCENFDLLTTINKVDGALVVSPRSDTSNPQITVLGANPLSIERGATLTDPGATATYDFDGDMTSRILVQSTVNMSIAGSYTITYSVTDTAGNSARAVRTVIVTKPVGLPTSCSGDAQGLSIFAASDLIMILALVRMLTVGGRLLRRRLSA